MNEKTKTKTTAFKGKRPTVASNKRFPCTPQIF